VKLNIDITGVSNLINHHAPLSRLEVSHAIKNDVRYSKKEIY